MKVSEVTLLTVTKLQRFLDGHPGEVFTAGELRKSGFREARKLIIPEGYKCKFGSLVLYGRPEDLEAVAKATAKNETKTKKGAQ